MKPSLTSTTVGLLALVSLSGCAATCQLPSRRELCSYHRCGGNHRIGYSIDYSIDHGTDHGRVKFQDHGRAGYDNNGTGGQAFCRELFSNMSRYCPSEGGGLWQDPGHTSGARAVWEGEGHATGGFDGKPDGGLERKQ